MAAPIISIITPTFNQGHFIAETIKSVLSQEGEFYIDYIIMDGASTDNTVSIITGFQKKLEENCDKKDINGLECFIPRTKGGSESTELAEFEFNKCLGISYRWVSQKDKGQADAINQGIQFAHGAVFAFINSDDVYMPHAFSSALSYFTTDVDVVYGNALYINEKGAITGIYPVEDIKTSSLAGNCFLSQPSVFIKMAAVKAAGDFNIRIRNSFDYEYWLRLEKQGFSFHFVRDVLSCTRIHGDTKTSRNREQIRLETMAIVRHYSNSFPLRWKQAFTHETMLLNRVADLCIRGANKIRHKLVKWYAPFFGRGLDAKIDKEMHRIFNSV